MICTAALLALIPALAGEPQIEWSAPDLYVDGVSFEVSVTVTAPADGAPVAGWMLTPSAFTVNGKPRDIPAGSTVRDLLASRKLADSMAIVERNGVILPRDAYAATTLEPGDLLEVVHAVGGG